MYTQFSKVIIIFLTLLVFLISRNALQCILSSNRSLSCIAEFPLVIGFCILFIFFLTSSYNFFGVYLSLEGLSLTLYVMVAMLGSSYSSIESAMKYFILGAISTAISLFGISLLYGIIGSLDFLSVYIYLNNSQSTFSFFEVKISLLFIIFGLFFKIGVYPCHS
jgi:NADH-quinone oxidoreductase subunit N